MPITLTRTLVVVASALITIGLYIQVGKIFKTRSAHDFSALLIFSLLLNELAWLNYGFKLSEWPIIAVSGCNLPAVILMGIGYYRFGKATL